MHAGEINVVCFFTVRCMQIALNLKQSLFFLLENENENTL